MITIEQVHAKKAVQAVIAATAINHLRELEARRCAAAKTGGAYWRQTVLEVLTDAGIPDADARGVAQIVAPYGALDFSKFVDRSSYHSALTTSEVAQKVQRWEAKKSRHSWVKDARGGAVE